MERGQFAAEPASGTEGLEQVEGIGKGVFLEDGKTLNEQYVFDTFGLGAAEAEQIVSYGKHTGTLAAMLADDRCPMNAQLAECYKEAGFEGSEQFLKGAAMMDRRFKIDISPETRTRNAMAVADKAAAYATEDVKKKTISPMLGSASLNGQTIENPR